MKNFLGACLKIGTGSDSKRFRQGPKQKGAYMNQPTAFPISEKELCDRFEKTWTPAVNDVLRELGYLEQTLPNNIMPQYCLWSKD